MEDELDTIRETETKHAADATKGPGSELEYWRRRVQRLTNLAEQLKVSRVIDVVTVVAAYSKSPDIETKQGTATLCAQ